MMKGTIYQSSTSHGRISYLLDGLSCLVAPLTMCDMGYTADYMDSSLTEKLCLGRERLSMYG